MKSEKFLNLVKVITLAVILSAGIQYVAAQTAPSWAPPLSQPPANNTYSPLNVGGTAQSKAGGLIIGTNNNLATGLLVLNGNVGFGVGVPTQKLDVSGNVKGTGFCLPGANPTGGCITTWPASVASAITCSGTCTQNIISKFLSPTTIGNGSISDTGNGVTPGRVGINTSGSSETFDVAGTNVSSVLGNFRLAAGINADTNNYVQSFSSRTQGSWKNIIFTPYYSATPALSITANSSGGGNPKVGIGTNNPQATLDVQGTIKITGSFTPTPNHVLTTDASGNASWQMPQRIRFDKWVEYQYVPFYMDNNLVSCQPGWIFGGDSRVNNGSIRCYRVDGAEFGTNGVLLQATYSNPAVSCPNQGGVPVCHQSATSDGAPYSG